MKPDWEDSPKWAEWYVCNGLGTGSWAEEEPVGEITGMWFYDVKSKVSFACFDWGDARKEKRQ